MSEQVTADTRERIIKVASAMFAQTGFTATSVRDIVKSANVNLGAITYHFGGKEQLMMEVLLRKAKPLNDIEQRVLRSRASPKQKLATLLREYAMQILHRDPELRIMFAESSHLCTKATFEHARDAMRHRSTAMSTILRDGMADGTFRPCNVERTVWAIFGMITPYVIHHPRVFIGKGEFYPVEFVEEVVTTSLALLLEGLVPVPKRNTTIKKLTGC